MSKQNGKGITYNRMFGKSMHEMHWNADIAAHSAFREPPKRHVAKNNIATPILHGVLSNRLTLCDLPCDQFRTAGA